MNTSMTPSTAGAPATHARSAGHQTAGHARSARRWNGAVLVGLLAALAVVLGACSGSAPNGSARASAPAAGGEGAGGGAGEGATTAYVNTQFHYRVDAPGAMTQAADGTATYSGSGEGLTIAVVTGSSPADPMALATAELTRLQTTAQGFALVSSPTAVTISGRQVVRAVYRWTNGTNAVTGNPNEFVSSIYAIPKDASTVALLRYSVGSSNYDPQGSDDLATTFTWQ